VARTLPVLLPACSQFVVEYAGDYLAQDPLTGRVFGTYLAGLGGTDGQIDFLVVPDATGALHRRVRWYGFPRNVDLSDDAPTHPTVRGPTTGRPPDTNAMLDVVPLRDLLMAVGVAVPKASVFFEHFADLPPAADYGVPDAVDAGAKYCVAWKPQDLTRGSLTRPKMIRITLTLDDPAARITEGQVVEYVLDLP
jgi:hypothetical protein